MKSRHFYLLSLIAVVFLMISCSSSSKQLKENVATSSEIHVRPVFHSSHEPKKISAPFSDVVQVGSTYYLAGQIGMDHSTREMVEGGIHAETIQTIENIQAVLKHHGLQLTDVVKVLVVLDDIKNFQLFNEIYTTYFPQKPARTTFAASALARNAKIEIEVVAVK